ncbi:zinc ribbon domain-containing protein, partial [bacterium]|nr:zinc ribbon domain-containing protein [bacterium]
MSKVCPHCDYPNFDDAKTCRRCRRDLPRPCPECGGAIAAGAGFCTHCGAIFDKKVDTSVYRKGPASPGDEPGEATNVRPIASRPVKLKHCMECGHTVDIR